MSYTGKGYRFYEQPALDSHEKMEAMKTSPAPLLCACGNAITITDREGGPCRQCVLTARMASCHPHPPGCVCGASIVEAFRPAIEAVRALIASLNGDLLEDFDGAPFPDEVQAAFAVRIANPHGS